MRLSRPTRAGWSRLATFAGLALLIAVPGAIRACGSTPAPDRSDSSRRRGERAAPPIDFHFVANVERDVWIRVLLSRLQGARRVVVDVRRAPRGAWRPVTVELGPHGTILRDGRRVETPGVSIGGAALRVGDRTYPTGDGPTLSVGPDPAGGLRAILEVPLEPYVLGVVAGEMPLSWPASALEAQAIAARTYVLHRRADRAGAAWDVTDDARSQVFVGAPDADRWASGLRAAVGSTRGQVLARDGRLANAVYHSTCGGHTVSTEEAFGATGADRIAGVRCDDCRAAPRRTWEVEIPLADLARATGNARAADLRTLAVASTRPSGRAAEIRAGRQTPQGVRHRTVTATSFRQALGAKLPSTWIDGFERTSNGFRVRGRGFGHGAGLCQWGAAGKARRGLSAAAILADYYPGFQIVRIPR